MVCLLEKKKKILSFEMRECANQVRWAHYEN